MTQLRNTLSVLFLLTFLSAGAARAVDQGDIEFQIQSLIRAANIGKTKVAVCVQDLASGQTLAKINVDEPMMPASNLKLLVSAAALSTLGPDFQFETQLIWHNVPTVPGEKPTAGNAVIRIRGDGDPAFGDDAVLRVYGKDIADAEALVQLWVDTIKKAGITRVATILIDDSVFDQEFVHESWPQDQLNRWYCAQVAGLNFFTNCLDVYPVPSATPGDSPAIRLLPQTSAVTTNNQATTGNTDTFWISRKLETNEITFRGTVKNKRLKPVNVTVHDPPVLFGRLLAERLGKAGIAVGEVRRMTAEDPAREGKALHIVKTPLATVLARCNKNSQNLYAECLFKRMGRKVTGASGSFDNGAAAVRLFLQKQIGTAAAGVRTADGSGLSRDNRVTARILIDVLAKMHADEKLAAPYFQSLSIAGVDGTLEDRLKELKGRVLAKTGYIGGVSTLSGYLLIPRKPRVAATNAAAEANIDPADCRVVAFSLLFNDFTPSLSVVQKLQDDVVKLLDKTLTLGK